MRSFTFFDEFRFEVEAASDLRKGRAAAVEGTLEDVGNGGRLQGNENGAQPNLQPPTPAHCQSDRPAVRVIAGHERYCFLVDTFNRLHLLGLDDQRLLNPALPAPVSPAGHDFSNSSTDTADTADTSGTEEGPFKARPLQHRILYTMRLPKHLTVVNMKVVDCPSISTKSAHHKTAPAPASRHERLGSRGGAPSNGSLNHSEGESSEPLSRKGRSRQLPDTGGSEDYGRAGGRAKVTYLLVFSILESAAGLQAPSTGSDRGFSSTLVGTRDDTSSSSLGTNQVAPGTGTGTGRGTNSNPLSRERDRILRHSSGYGISISSLSSAASDANPTGTSVASRTLTIQIYRLLPPFDSLFLLTHPGPGSTSASSSISTSNSASRTNASPGREAAASTGGMTSPLVNVGSIALVMSSSKVTSLAVSECLSVVAVGHAGGSVDVFFGDLRRQLFLAARAAEDVATNAARPASGSTGTGSGILRKTLPKGKVALSAPIASLVLSPYDAALRRGGQYLYVGTSVFVSCYKLNESDVEELLWQNTGLQCPQNGLNIISLPSIGRPSCAAANLSLAALVSNDVKEVAILHGQTQSDVSGSSVCGPSKSNRSLAPPSAEGMRSSKDKGVLMRLRLGDREGDGESLAHTDEDGLATDWMKDSQEPPEVLVSSTTFLNNQLVILSKRATAGAFNQMATGQSEKAMRATSFPRNPALLSAKSLEGRRAVGSASASDGAIVRVVEFLPFLSPPPDDGDASDRSHTPLYAQVNYERLLQSERRGGCVEVFVAFNMLGFTAELGDLAYGGIRTNLNPNLNSPRNKMLPHPIHKDSPCLSGWWLAYHSMMRRCRVAAMRGLWRGPSSVEWELAKASAAKITTPAVDEAVSIFRRLLLLQSETLNDFAATLDGFEMWSRRAPGCRGKVLFHESDSEMTMKDIVNHFLVRRVSTEGPLSGVEFGSVLAIVIRSLSKFIESGAASEGDAHFFVRLLIQFFQRTDAVEEEADKGEGQRKTAKSANVCCNAHQNFFVLQSRAFSDGSSLPRATQLLTYLYSFHVDEITADKTRQTLICKDWSEIHTTTGHGRCQGRQAGAVNLQTDSRLKCRVLPCHSLIEALAPSAAGKSPAPLGISIGPATLSALAAVKARTQFEDAGLFGFAASLALYTSPNPLEDFVALAARFALLPVISFLFRLRRTDLLQLLPLPRSAKEFGNRSANLQSGLPLDGKQARRLLSCVHREKKQLALSERDCVNRFIARLWRSTRFAPPAPASDVSEGNIGEDCWDVRSEAVRLHEEELRTSHKANISLRRSKQGDNYVSGETKILEALQLEKDEEIVHELFESATAVFQKFLVANANELQLDHSLLRELKDEIAFNFQRFKNSGFSKQDVEAFEQLSDIHQLLLTRFDYQQSAPVE